MILPIEPRYHPCRPPSKTSCPYVKLFSYESAHRQIDRRTDTHTHQSDSMTSTADAVSKYAIYRNMLNKGRVRDIKIQYDDIDMSIN